MKPFFTKARVQGAELDKLRNEDKVRDLEAKLRFAEAKAENDAEELRQALADMQLIKERYQMALIEIVEVLSKYGMVI